MVRSSDDGSCHRCSTDLSAQPYIDLLTNTGLSASGHEVQGRRCDRCHWLNILSLLRNDFPFDGPEESPTNGPKLDVPDSENAAEIFMFLQRSRASLVSELRNMINEHPDQCRGLLLQLLGQFPAENTPLRDKLSLAIQQIYACLLENGPVWVAGEEVAHTFEPAFETRLFSTVALVSVLSSAIRELGLGSLVRPRIAGRRFSSELSTDAAMAYEVNLNAARSDSADPLKAQVGVAMAELSAYGVSTLDLLAVVRSPEQLRPHLRVQTAGALIMIDLARPGRLRDALCKHVLLSLENWQEHEVPSFLFADRRLVSRTRQAMSTQASELDWLRYAPLLAGAHGDSDRPQLVGVTTVNLVERAETRAQGDIAGRLALAEKFAKGSPNDGTKTVGELVRQVHADFERHTARICEQAGMLSWVSLHDLNHREIPCGEIDVVASCPIEDADLVIVIECKNVDIDFIKDFSPEQAATTIAKASAQVQRKAQWLAPNWSLVCAERSRTAAHTRHVVGLVVTRRVGFPQRPGQAPVVTAADLNDVLIHLIKTPISVWRPDLRLARL